MKKITTLASALLLIAGALVSCQKNELVETPLGPTSFTASVAQSTKVTLDGYTPKFEVGDQLFVSDGFAEATFEVTSVSATGDANLEIVGSWSGTPQAPYYIYSVAPNYGVSNGALMGIPAPGEVRNAESNSISLAALVAQTNELSNVTMLNATALFKVTVPSEVKALRFVPTLVPMFTEADVIFDAEGITLDTSFAVETASDVLFTGNNGESLAAGTYYLPVIPQEFYGLKVGFTTDGTEYVWKERSSNFTLERNKVYNLGNLADWAPAEPPAVYSVEDFIGTYEGTSGMGLQVGETGTPGINQQATTSFVIEASDDPSKGNLKFTKFDDVDCVPVIYCTVDLATGNITIPANSVFQSEQGPAVSDREVVLIYNPETKGYSCSAIVNQMAPGYFKGIVLNIVPASAPEPEPEPGISAEDFVGTFVGGIKEDLYIAGNFASTNLDALNGKFEFVFELGTESNTVVLTKFYDKNCNVVGELDSDEGSLTFASGTLSVSGAYNQPISSPLVLKLSQDKLTLSQIGKLALGSGVAVYEITLSTLTKKGTQAPTTFALSDVSGFNWELSYDVDGQHWVDDDVFSFKALTETQAMNWGGNLYGSGQGGASNTIIVNFDLSTGEMTIPSAKVSGLVFSGIVEYDSKGDRLRVPRDLTGDVVMQFAEDKNSFSVASIRLTAGDERYGVGEKTLTNVTFAKK